MRPPLPLPRPPPHHIRLPPWVSGAGCSRVGGGVSSCAGVAGLLEATPRAPLRAGLVRPALHPGRSPEGQSLLQRGRQEAWKALQAEPSHLRACPALPSSMWGQHASGAWPATAPRGAPWGAPLLVPEACLWGPWVGLVCTPLSSWAMKPREPTPPPHAGVRGPLWEGSCPDTGPAVGAHLVAPSRCRGVPACSCGDPSPSRDQKGRGDM